MEVIFSQGFFLALSWCSMTCEWIWEPFYSGQSMDLESAEMVLSYVFITVKSSTLSILLNLSVPGYNVSFCKMRIKVFSFSRAQD